MFRTCFLAAAIAVLLTGGSHAQRFIEVKPTLDSLLATDPRNKNTAWFVKGTSAEWDGGEGIYVYDPNADDPPGDGIFTPAFPHPGRFYKIVPGFSGAINVKSRPYGARGDGVTDDTAAIQAALNAANAAGGGTIVIPPGRFVVDQLKVYSNTTIIGTRGKSILDLATNGWYCISVNQYDAGTPDPSENISRVTIDGITFHGNSETEGMFEHRHLLNLNAASHVTVKNCDFLAPQGDGIYVGSGNLDGIERHNEHILIEGNLFDGINQQNRNGVTIIDGTDVTIRKNVFRRLTADLQPGCVDIEPNGHGFERLRDILIEDNFIEDCNGAMGISMSVGPISAPPSGITIKDNFFSATNSIYSAMVYVATSYPITTNTEPMGITIQGNKMFQTNICPVRVQYVRGVKILENEMRGTIHAIIGNESTTTNITMDVDFSRNTMIRCGSNLGMVAVGHTAGLTMEHNIFDAPTSTGPEATGFITFYGEPAGTTAKDVTIAFNAFLTGLRTNLNYLVYAAGCTISTNSFALIGNKCNDVTMGTARAGLNPLNPSYEISMYGGVPTLGFNGAQIRYISGVLRAYSTFQSTGDLWARSGDTNSEIKIGDFGSQPGLALKDVLLTRSGTNQLALAGDFYASNLWSRSGTVKLGDFSGVPGLSLGDTMLTRSAANEFTVLGDVKATNLTASGTTTSGKLVATGDGGGLSLQIATGNAIRSSTTGSGSSIYYDTETHIFRNSADAYKVQARMDGSTTAGDTRLLLWDVDANSLKRVSVGAADSGGTGFKVLRIPN